MPDGRKGNNLKDSYYCPLRENFVKDITGLAFPSLFLPLFIMMTVNHNQISVLQFQWAASHIYIYITIYIYIYNLFQY